ILNFEHITNNANKLISEFDVRTPSEMQMVNKLSGGNQQKVIIAREISLNPDLLIAVQPTRGLDVGAIEFIHRSIIDERNVGKGVLLISFELDEILDLSDRIAVMYEGKIVSVLDANKTDSNEVGLLMAGGKN
ncbi:MAG: heme ABC transporter ATP-binding protein, partial [Clostridiales bacterium]|nr:heme ABC transporter ATP-binding protein [Clostridiales bacterium]